MDDSLSIYFILISLHFILYILCSLINITCKKHCNTRQFLRVLLTIYSSLIITAIIIIIIISFGTGREEIRLQPILGGHREWQCLDGAECKAQIGARDEARLRRIQAALLPQPGT